MSDPTSASDAVPDGPADSSAPTWPASAESSPAESSPAESSPAEPAGLPAPDAPVPGAAPTWPTAADGASAAVPPAYPPAPVGSGQTSSTAIIALILAVLSWAFCPIVAAVVALVLAASAAKEIAASGGRVEGTGLVTAARIVAWVNIGVSIAVLVLVAFFGLLVLVAGGSFTGN